MQLEEFANRLKRSAIATKEHVCRKRPTDLLPYVVANRGNDPIALVTIHQHVRDTILDVAALTATGLDADSLGMVFESYMQIPVPDHPELDRINPVTHQPWRPGEMHVVATQHDGIAKGWVEENLGIVVGNRAGDIVMINQAFHYKGGHLVWDEDKPVMSTMNEGDKVAGLMPEAIIRMMTRPSAAQMLPPDFPHDEHERDSFVAQMLTQQGNAVMLYADITDTTRVAKLQKRNPGSYFI